MEMEENHPYPPIAEGNPHVKKAGVCLRCCICPTCLTKHNPLTAHSTPSRRQRAFYALLCPPHALPGRIYTVLLIFVVLYGCVYVLAEKEALPGWCVKSTSNASSDVAKVSNDSETQRIVNLITKADQTCSGNFFALFLVFVLSMLVGHFISFAHLPPLLGMLMVGCFLRNAAPLDFARSITKEWSALLRSIALCIILIRAGLGLDPGTLRRLSAVVFRLAFTPCLVETLVTCVTSRFLLGLPWAWGIMLGFVLAAVSPAVVVPCMIHLETTGLGVAKGIPTLVIAAASVDDVLAISGFQILLSIAFSSATTNIGVTLIRGPLEALLGVVYGVVGGVVLWYIPPKKTPRFILYRFALLFGLGVVALLGCVPAHVPGAGALGCLTLALVASVGWRARDGWTDDNNPLVPVIDTLWWMIQPFLFGLIGAEVDFQLLDPATVGKGLGCLCIGIMFRSVASFICVMGTDLTLKERLFIPFAWLPKATVQAAIGSVAMDTAIKVGNTEGIMLGYQVLTVAVLSIVVTAPLGAALITLLAPHLLSKTPKEVSIPNDTKLQGNSSPHLKSHDPEQDCLNTNLEMVTVERNE